MQTVLISAAALSAVCAIAADWNERKPPIFLLLKPLTTALIIALVLQAPDSSYRTLLIVGLVLSLCGDVCLMFENNRAFLGGLSSFLLAHLLFAWAFVADLGGSFILPWWSAAFVIYGIGFAWLLVPRAGALAAPVVVYGAILMAMAITASIRWATLDTTASLYALIGASLFVISDSVLGLRKFVGPYFGAQGAILSTYWLSIGLIAMSAFL